jgi:serine protease Do
VKLSDEREFQARIVGRDPQTDIAVLKIESKDLVPLSLGDSEGIDVGDWVVAIGNPFGLSHTVSAGIISAKGRTREDVPLDPSGYYDFLQTDASINPGNSGGPLLDMKGQVVGINTAIRGGGAQGLGFATPINTAKRLLPQLKQGKVTRGYLGMGILDLSEDARAGFELPPDTRGALVQTVEPGLPAAKAGIQPGDIIVEIDGRPIASNRALIDYISYLPVGSKINLTVIRNGKRQTLTASTIERTLEADKDDATKQPEEAAPARNKLGMSVQELTPQTRQTYGIADSVSGVVVTGVKEVSPAGDVLTEGDVISEVQGTKVSNLAQFRAAIDRLKGGSIARIYVTSSGRGGAAISGYRFIHVP